MYLKIPKAGDSIEFQLNGKEVVGIVKEINVRINEYEKCVWYEVEYLGELYLIDGELYQIIKTCTS